MSNGTPPPVGTTDPRELPAPAQPQQRITRFPYPFHAVLIVNGAEYWEWESVSVRCAFMGNPASSARFTVSEMEHGYPLSRSAWRIRPGDSCTVVLDGYLVITGQVETRQVAYNAKTHAVELQVTSKTSLLKAAAAQKTGGEFKGKNLQAIATELAGKAGVGVHTIGNMSQVFDRFSIRPGERIMEAIERGARQAGAFLGTNEKGQLVLSDGSYTNYGGRLVEGVNILEGRECIHSMAASAGKIQADGQKPGTDDVWGGMANMMTNAQQSVSKYGASGFNLAKIVNEMPSFVDSMLKNRGQMENNVGSQDTINVTIVTLGWQRNTSAGGIWLPGEAVFVDSPMLIMQRDLIIKAVTFSQDNDTGSRSTLELVDKSGMGGKEQAE